MSRLDLSTGQITELIAKGTVSEIVLSPDGNRLAALDRQPESTTILTKPIEGGDWNPIAKLEGAGYAYLRWLPDGTLLYGKEGTPNSAIFRVALPDGRPHLLADLKSFDHVHEVRMRPDGRQVVFQSYITRTDLWALENFLPQQYMEPGAK
jgi:hypothetical protein